MGEASQTSEVVSNEEAVGNGEAVGNVEAVANVEAVGNGQAAADGEVAGNGEAAASGGEAANNGEAAANAETTGNGETASNGGSADGTGEQPNSESNIRRVCLMGHDSCQYQQCYFCLNTKDLHYLIIPPRLNTNGPRSFLYNLIDLKVSAEREVAVQICSKCSAFLKTVDRFQAQALACERMREQAAQEEAMETQNEETKQERTDEVPDKDTDADGITVKVETEESVVGYNVNGSDKIGVKMETLVPGEHEDGETEMEEIETKPTGIVQAEIPATVSDAPAE